MYVIAVSSIAGIIKRDIGKLNLAELTLAGKLGGDISICGLSLMIPANKIIEIAYTPPNTTAIDKNATRFSLNSQFIQQSLSASSFPLKLAQLHAD